LGRPRYTSDTKGSSRMVGGRILHGARETKANMEKSVSRDLRELELSWEDVACSTAAEDRQRRRQRVTQCVSRMRGESRSG